jgi:MYXO-CTERM domain-containing protein
MLPDDPGNTITGADVTFSSAAAFTVVHTPDGASTAGLTFAGVGLLALIRRRI